jgi:hypothetical protein
MRYWELEHDTSSYNRYRSQTSTIHYAKGARDSLGYAIALLMKYKHRCPGVTLGEVGAAIEQLNKSKMFEATRSEHLPVPAGIA